MCMPSCVHTHVCMHAELPQSCLTLATLWTVAHQAPLSWGFSRQEYWSGLPFPPPGELPESGIQPSTPVSPTLQADSLPLSHEAQLSKAQKIGFIGDHSGPGVNSKLFA